MTTLSSRDLQRIGQALAVWAEGVEGAARARVAQLERPKDMSADTVGNLAKEILFEVVKTLLGAVSSVFEAMPNWVGTDVQAHAIATTLLDLIAAKSNVLVENVVQREVDVERFTVNLMNNPKAVALARQCGAGTPTLVREYARAVAIEAAENLRLVIAAAVPVVMDVAREPTSVATLEAQLCRGLQRRPWWRF